MNQKKLYRSKENRFVAGVLGGLGEYAQVDPTLLRLLWLLLTVFSGFVPGIVAYIFAIVVIPEEKSS